MEKERLLVAKHMLLHMHRLTPVRNAKLPSNFPAPQGLPSIYSIVIAALPPNPAIRPSPTALGLRVWVWHHPGAGRGTGPGTGTGTRGVRGPLTGPG